MKIFNKITIFSTAIVLNFILFSNSSIASYKDVLADSSHSESVTFLELQGAIKASDKFGPSELINRASAYKIIFTLFKEIIGTS